MMNAERQIMKVERSERHSSLVASRRSGLHQS